MSSALAHLRPEHPVPVDLTDLAVALGLEPRGLSAPDGVQVTGATLASDEVRPGDLFVALAGFHSHGARFAAAAVAAGAVAIVTDPAGVELVRAEGLDRTVPVLEVPDARLIAGPVAAVVYGNPSRSLTTVGITGSNGKTTTTYFVDAALAAAYGPTASLGTVEVRLGADAVASPRTTVEAPVLHATFALAAERGIRAAVTEVSSHAIALGRVRGAQFDVVAFTNLQRDHLDFHVDMEGYFAAKAALFAPEYAATGVVVIDDAWGRRLAASSAIPVQTVATHVGDPVSEGADWAVVEAEIGLDGVGSAFLLRGPDGVRHEAHSPLPGLVNVSNAATAIVTAHAAGVELATAIEAVGRAHAVPGRMERVIERGAGFPLCLVDFAHTPDALELALEAVRPITPGRLVIVFGSDGDRDQGKRPIMGEIAARLADVLIVTDENPRSEDPAAIRRAILEGAFQVRPDGRDVVESTVSRAAAIDHALALAGDDGDTVIITGKGHEPSQEIAGVFHPYNDRDVLLAIRQRREDAAGEQPA